MTDISFKDLVPRDRTRDKARRKNAPVWQFVPPKPRGPRDRSNRHKINERTIIAIDGEGHNSGRDHLYDLLAASTREFVAATDGLSTRQCFEFLLALKRDVHTRYTIVGFSLGYDVNMWLRDLPRKSLDVLVHEGHVYWGEYALQWKQHKTFSIYNRRTKRYVLIYDVFGFFQTSFVDALYDWKIGDENTIDDIADMKEKRGTFRVEDALAVREYCFKECELLVQLMRRLIAAVQHAEIPCSQWYGVGALASGLLRKYNIKKYLTEPVESMRDYILGAYFGGRFEIVGNGHFGKVHGYDIKSAYPSVARNLPCLVHTKYVQRTRYKGEINSLLHVEWKLEQDMYIGEMPKFGPFPWRASDNDIWYPRNGRGWYWSVEVDAAMRLYPGCIKILDAYIAETTCDDKPFAFINEIYAERRRLETTGDYAHKALKLAMNAIYGKTAQSLGSKEKKPPYQAYIWAGMITAGTRAVILDAIRESKHSVISIATDGILSIKPIKSLKIGKGLGEWEHGTSENSFLVQPGIYRLSDPCPHNYKEDYCDHRLEHTRGFGHTETDFDVIERDFALFAKIKGPMQHTYKATRFVGAASALSHVEYKQYWRKWIETKRIIHFGTGKRWPLNFKGDPRYHGIGSAPGSSQIRGGMPESTPYEPKQTWLESFLEDVDVVLDFDSM